MRKIWEAANASLRWYEDMDRLVRTLSAGGVRLQLHDAHRARRSCRSQAPRSEPGGGLRGVAPGSLDLRTIGHLTKSASSPLHGETTGERALWKASWVGRRTSAARYRDERPVGRPDHRRDVCAQRAPLAGKARPGARGTAPDLRGAARALRGPRRRPRRARPAAGDRVLMQLPNTRVRRQLSRAKHDRRHSGDGAARAPPRRGAALPARFRRGRLRHPRRRRRLRLPGDGAGDAGRVPRR